MEVILDGVKIALGTFEMISAVVWEHRREHRGRYPRMLVMHPEVFNTLITELEHTHKLNIYMQDLHDPRKDPKFMGVLILLDSEAVRPKLVDVNNEVIYI